MRTGLVGLALICVVLIFLFPVGQGPFSATHGPATALRAQRAALLLILTVILSAILIVAHGAILSLCHPTVGALPHPSAAQNSQFRALTSVLLC